MATKTQTKIQIGHSAYNRNSQNRYLVCPTKRAAVEELRERGFKRNDARALVNEVMNRDGGYAVGRATEHGDPVEVLNRSTEDWLLGS